MTISIPEQLDATRLLTPDQFEGVARTVRDNNPGMEGALAQRIVTEALKYVAVCAPAPTVPLRPSRVVDEGWHALILHTALYADLCTRLGRFVHHYPEAPDATRHDPGALARTVKAIKSAGYPVDAPLWGGPSDSGITVAAGCEHSDPGQCGQVPDCGNTGPN